MSDFTDLMFMGFKKPDGDKNKKRNKRIALIILSCILCLLIWFDFQIGHALSIAIGGIIGMFLVVIGIFWSVRQIFK